MCAARIPGRAPWRDMNETQLAEHQYGVLLRRPDRGIPPPIGTESALLTHGQVRGFQAQQEIRAMRAEQVRTRGFDPLAGLTPTNDSLHRFVGGINSGTAAEDRMRTGAALQGHGLVHTARRPGQVLLGSRESAPYRALAAQGRYRTANVQNWDIHRNDAFMAGALLGHNQFSVPLQNPEAHYIDNSARARARPGRVTVREIAQMHQFGERPLPGPSGIRATLRDDHFVVGWSRAVATPGAMHGQLLDIGNAVQVAPRPIYAMLPNLPPAPGSGGDGQ